MIFTNIDAMLLTSTTSAKTGITGWDLSLLTSTKSDAPIRGKFYNITLTPLVRINQEWKNILYMSTVMLSTCLLEILSLHNATCTKLLGYRSMTHSNQTMCCRFIIHSNQRDQGLIDSRSNLLNVITVTGADIPVKDTSCLKGSILKEVIEIQHNSGARNLFVSF